VRRFVLLCAPFYQVGFMTFSHVGTDLVWIPDLVDSVARHGQRFIARVFTEGEMAYCRAAPSDCALSIVPSYASLAVRFAAKEAVMKLLRPDSDTVLLWTSIDVIRTSQGAPEIRLSGNAEKLAKIAGFSRIEVSLTHAGDYASATALAVLAAV